MEKVLFGNCGMTQMFHVEHTSICSLTEFDAGMFYIWAFYKPTRKLLRIDPMAA